MDNECMKVNLGFEVKVKFKDKTFASRVEESYQSAKKLFTYLLFFICTLTTTHTVQCVAPGHSQHFIGMVGMKPGTTIVNPECMCIIGTGKEGVNALSSDLILLEESRHRGKCIILYMYAYLHIMANSGHIPANGCIPL